MFLSRIKLIVGQCGFLRVSGGVSLPVTASASSGVFSPRERRCFSFAFCLSRDVLVFSA